MSLRVRQLLGMLIGLGMLAALVLHSGLWGSRSALVGLPTGWWVAAPLLLLASHAMRAARIHAELNRHGRVGFGACLRIGLLHSAAVNLVPMRGGELAYPWLVHRHARIGRLQAVASLLRMRAQDMAVLASLLLLCWPGWSLAGRLAAVLVWAGVLLLAVAQFRRRIKPLPEHAARGLRLLQALAAGGPNIAWGWCFSTASWALKLGAIAAMLAVAAGLPAQTALRAALAGELSALWPLQAPAGLGTYEAAVWLAVGWPVAGAPAAAVVGAALLAHAVVWLSTLGAATVAWLSWGRVRIANPGAGCGAIESDRMNTASSTRLAWVSADTPRDPPRELPAHRLSVVVPMYNERANVEPMLDDLQAAMAHYPWPWELVIVDDGSRDGTGSALEHRARAIGPHVRVLRLRRNFRQTAAMQAGIDAARGDVIVTLDGDLQNDPRDIPTLVARLLVDQLDLVVGHRRDRQDGFWLRRLPSQLANVLIGRMTGLPFRDFGCSLKAYRASVLHEVRLYGEMHRFIPAWLATVTAPERMAEVDVNHRARSAGRSKYGLSRTFRVMVDLLAVHFFLHYGSRPGHFFGGIGLLVGGLGAAILTWLATLKFVFGEDIGGRPLLSLGFFCVLGGLQFLTTGVLAELLVRVYHGRDGAHSSYALQDRSPAMHPDEAWHGPR